MDYKKIIKRKEVRFTMLRMLSFVPDGLMVRLQYYIKLRRWPNLKHPTRFSEKLQCYKLRYHNPLLGQCVDKYTVRQYVQSKGLGDILNELYGVFDRADDIPFEHLPNRFVIKTTDGLGAGVNVMICTDKTCLDITATVKKVNSWLNMKLMNPGREWAYSQINQSRIIVEKYIDSAGNKDGLIDYKFFCFDGEPHYMYIIRGRKLGEGAFLGIYDIKYNKLNVYRCDEKRAIEPQPIPENYERMVEIARQLSSDFPHVRVDLYNVEGKIIFGELTFYDGSGYMSYDPDSFDIEMGRLFTTYK